MVMGMVMSGEDGGVLVCAHKEMIFTKKKESKKKNESSKGEWKGGIQMAFVIR